MVAAAFGPDASAQHGPMWNDYDEAVSGYASAHRAVLTALETVESVLRDAQRLAEITGWRSPAVAGYRAASGRWRDGMRAERERLSMLADDLAADRMRLIAVGTLDETGPWWATT